MAACKANMQKAVDYLSNELSTLSVWRANKSLVESINVDTWYGMMNVGSIANITTPDAQTIRIEPWDKGVMAGLEKGIYDADTGLTPQNQGDYIMIKIPALTQERRQEIAKKVKQMGEDAKATVRKRRQEERDAIKKLHDEKEISEDQKNADEANVDVITKEFNDVIDDIVKTKSQDVLSM